MKDSISKTLGDFNEKDTPFTEPIIFTGFMAEFYSSTEDMTDVRRVMKEKLDEYNDMKAQMNLVLFDQAIEHVCRITRIIELPSGHALLVGVGGSGKQSLSKLSSFICQYNITTITISQEYKINQFKEDLQKMYNSTGQSEDTGFLFIFTEGQIVDEKFMVPVNDLLSSGEVQDLFSNDDKEVVINKLRNACKSTTGKDSPADVWNFFIGRVKKNLHMSICFSPGDNLRNKARKFPAIVNSTVIDWFQPWPEEALYSVCKEKLQKELDDLPEKEYFESVIKFMPNSFKVVGDRAKDMLDIDKRFTYVTPKSFLELLKLFTTMYKSKIEIISANKNKLDSGLKKLFEAKEKISNLEKELEIKTVEINKIKIIAEENDRVAREQAAIVGQEAAIAEDEERKVTAQAKDIGEESDKCEKELNNLKPLMETALRLANGLEKKDLDAVKAIKPSPPAIILEVLCAILIMVAGQIDSFIKLLIHFIWS